MENTTSIPHDGQTPPASDAVARGHETSDAHVKPVVMFIVIMFLAAGVIHAAVWGFMHHEQHRNTRTDPAASPFADQHEPPPEPRLQPSVSHPSQPHEDLAALRESWRKDLTTSGPVPGQPDHVRIPIAEVMRLMAEQGLPPTPTTRPGGAP